MIKFKKKMKYLKGFILYALLCIFAFMPFMSFNTYAWSVDSNGNLVSDNLINNSTSVFELGAVSYNVGLTYGQNKVSSNARIRTINLIDVDSTKTYSLSVPSPYLVIAQGYNNGLNVNAAGTQFNQALSNLSFTGVSQVSIIVRKIDNSNFSSVNDISSIDLMFNEGSLMDYEPYGKMYYSQSNIERIAYNDYNVYQFASDITITYSNGTSIGTLVSYDNIISAVQDGVFTFTNGSLTLVYSYLNTLSGGNASWFYTLSVTFRNNRVMISNFDDWSITNYGANLYFLSYGNTSYSSASATGNPLTIKLTSHGFNGSDYLKQISFDLNSAGATPLYNFRYVGVSSTTSIDYVNGYNNGINEGYDDGFDDGFTDGKNEGYTMGYNEGYRDGSTEDFTTNGFKSLIGSIFNYPINFIRSVFNFEFMGINISSIVFFVLSIGIVIFVIKRFKR